MGGTSCKIKTPNPEELTTCSERSVVPKPPSEFVNTRCLERSEIRMKCKQLPKCVHAESHFEATLPPCAGGVGLFPPCPKRDATHVLELRKPPSFAVKTGVREFLRKASDGQGVDANWRSLVDDIVRETDPCPPPPTLGGEKAQDCFSPQQPSPPPTAPNAWTKRKCAEEIQKRVMFEKPALPSSFGPGGDACMASTPLEELDPAELWKDASKTRNVLTERRNALTARFNVASAELDELLKDNIELRDQLMRVRCSSGFSLTNTEPASERHISEALQMVRDTVSFRDWEVRQLDELLDTLTFLEHDSRRRSQRTTESFDILSSAMPNIVRQVKACKKNKRETHDDLARLLGEMAGLLDRCVSPENALDDVKVFKCLLRIHEQIRLPIFQWRKTRASLRPAVVLFHKAMGDFKCGNHYAPPWYLKEFLSDSGMPYARDHDAIDKFLADSTLFTLIHDMDMVFELLTTLAKQTTDQGLNAIRESDRKEIYRPWNTMFKDEPTIDQCSMLPGRTGKIDKT